jgi:predicted nucleic acid-binding protein
MNVLLDINVILDVLLNRAPWVSDAADVWDAHDRGRLNAYVAAFSIPTIFYVVRRQNDLTEAHEAVRICLETLEISPVGRSTLEFARQQSQSDFEDSLQIASAIEASVDAIVTRDPAGFAQSPVPAISPTDLLAQLSAENPREDTE